MKSLLALALTLFWLPLQAAAEPVAPLLARGLSEPTLRDKPELACPLPAGQDRLVQVSQTDCCKGHKGVCGCRAGKIVCCDNTVSVNCTCHADSGVDN